MAKVGSSISKFNRMIEECEKGNLDIILTKSVSCFGRDTVVIRLDITQVKSVYRHTKTKEEYICST